MEKELEELKKPIAEKTEEKLEEKTEEEVKEKVEEKAEVKIVVEVAEEKPQEFFVSECVRVYQVFNGTNLPMQVVFYLKMVEGEYVNFRVPMQRYNLIV